MKILLLGSGGREHALAWKIAQSPRTETLFIAPGNAGTEKLGRNVELDLADFDEIAAFVIDNDVQMLVVGPEVPLVEGIADYFAGHDLLRHVAVIGPSQAGAKLEGSKDFAKAFMMRHGIPTAAYRSFTEAELAEAETFLATLRPPYVLKADGLAAGKGVIISPSLDQARRDLREMLGGKFGKAGTRVVIEEF
ncbi:MAG: phosphoribosylamine--glycine ligase, partial [Alloprevotella sp.]|nr:phosphoribosylamine--glycine ligase [Alloprevotella sp.]